MIMATGENIQKMIDHLKKRFPKMRYVGHNTSTIYFCDVLDGRRQMQEQANNFIKQYFNSEMNVFIFG
jgi:hypothetical protein